MAIEKEDIVQYVQETPGNSNPAVLRSLLNQLEDSGEGATFKVKKEEDEKSYQSAYTGAEIDAAVAKAGTVPAVTSADAGKALVVDEEGKIVTGEAGGGTIINFNNCEVIDDTDAINVIIDTVFDTKSEANAFYSNIITSLNNGVVFCRAAVTNSGVESIPVGTIFMYPVFKICQASVNRIFIIVAGANTISPTTIDIIENSVGFSVSLQK